MAKKTQTLSFRSIVLGAEADVIRQALEARLEIDRLVEERRVAYERIAALESQVEELLGEEGVFPFPPPPLPVAGIDPKLDALMRQAAPAPKGRAAKASRAAAAQDEAGQEADGEAGASDAEALSEEAPADDSQS